MTLWTELKQECILKETMKTTELAELLEHEPVSMMIKRCLLQVLAECVDDAVDGRLESRLESRSQQNVVMPGGRRQLRRERSRMTHDDRTQSEVSL